MHQSTFVQKCPALTSSALPPSHLNVQLTFSGGKVNMSTAPKLDLKTWNLDFTPKATYFQCILWSCYIIKSECMFLWKDDQKWKQLHGVFTILHLKCGTRELCQCILAQNTFCSFLIHNASSVKAGKIAPGIDCCITRPIAGGGAGGARAPPPEIFRLELNSATEVEFFY